MSPGARQYIEVEQKGNAGEGIWEQAASKVGGKDRVDRCPRIQEKRVQGQSPCIHIAEKLSKMKNKGNSGHIKTEAAGEVGRRAMSAVEYTGSLVEVRREWEVRKWRRKFNSSR